MNIHEYQSKEILRAGGVTTPEGNVAFNIEEAIEQAKKLNTNTFVIKAQIHAGGRGKAGGVKIAHNLEEVERFATELFGKVLVTHQTGNKGKIVKRLLIEAGAAIKKEYYLSFVVDRKIARVVMIGSEEGGIEIEKVAAEKPGKIFKEFIDPAIGLANFQATRIAYKMNFPRETIHQATKLMKNLYTIFIEKDCSLVEINPLVVTQENEIMALDAKLNFDDSAIYRHPEIKIMRDETEEDPKELRAAEAGLNYVNLGGNVACMVNGAGLAMATVDILKYFGGEPANFLDVGGDSTPKKIAEAFRIMLEDGQAKGVFVNIFGGINKCDLVAQGILEATKIISSDGKILPVPVVVRLQGTNVELGKKILKEAMIANVIMAETMEDGARKIVQLVNQVA